MWGFIATATENTYILHLVAAWVCFGTGFIFFRAFLQRDNPVPQETIYVVLDAPSLHGDSVGA